ncbi:MAG: hypothetical protein EA383_08515 [Spirochaetaceae bacterium]|nr:MAG: hypothetical protein EA383_08515 [Spirochaetaceae bacterium]
MCPFFRHDRRLFAGVSRLIYRIIDEFYAEAAGRPLLTGTVIGHQTFGDMLRFNPHFHAIVLEGGFDDEGTFFYIPFSGLQSMTELFRRRVIKFLVGQELLNDDFTRNVLSWKHSGFSISARTDIGKPRLSGIGMIGGVWPRSRTLTPGRTTARIQERCWMIW